MHLSQPCRWFDSIDHKNTLEEWKLALSQLLPCALQYRPRTYGSAVSGTVGFPWSRYLFNTNLPHVHEEHESMTRCCTPVVGLVDVRFIVSLAELLSTTGDTYSESGLLSYAIRNKLPRCHSAKKGGTESVNNTSCEFHAS